MKYSRQRELILETVMENPVHPTADTVYAMVREQEPNISLGTVYRNLNLLAEQGILRRIPMPAASDRFDGRTDSHHHMRCCGCGNLFDLPIAEFAGLEEQLKNLAGFSITGYQILFEGFCPACAGKHLPEQGGRNIAESG